MYEHSTNAYQCVCNIGFEGDGLECNEQEVSCVLSEDVCDIHATCQYSDTLGKSLCVCDPGYEGNGKTCNIGKN